MPSRTPKPKEPTKRPEPTVSNGATTSTVNPLEPLPMVRALLLALLRANPGSSGYDLMKLVRHSTHEVVELKSGTVYPELKRLERDGLVTSKQEGERRKRRSYQLTEMGTKELKQLLHQIQFRIKNILQPLIRIIENSSSDSV